MRLGCTCRFRLHVYGRIKKSNPASIQCACEIFKKPFLVSFHVDDVIAANKHTMVGVNFKLVGNIWVQGCSMLSWLKESRREMKNYLKTCSLLPFKGYNGEFTRLSQKEDLCLIHVQRRQHEKCSKYLTELRAFLVFVFIFSAAAYVLTIKIIKIHATRRRTANREDEVKRLPLPRPSFDNDTQPDMTMKPQRQIPNFPPRRY